jgi:hypothetical protein
MSGKNVQGAFNQGIRKGIKAASIKLAEEYGLDPEAVEQEIAAKLQEAAAAQEGGGEEAPVEEAPITEEAV